ncbi:MAG: hypothetical protein ACI9XZ_001709, partial [Alphaproteobacteria bacterium]
MLTVKHTLCVFCVDIGRVAAITFYVNPLHLKRR